MRNITPTCKTSWESLRYWLSAPSHLSSTNPVTTVMLSALLVATSLGCGEKNIRTAASQAKSEQQSPPAVLSSPPSEPKRESAPATPSTNPGSGGDVAWPSRAYFEKIDSAPIDQPVALEPRRNDSIVLVVMDAVNPRHLGAYGYSRPTSPNIDALARAGVLFTDHVSNSSWTRPSFTTILTGLPKREHKVELSNNQLSRKINTLAERLRSAGYRTAGFVGNPLVRRIWGFAQGFDTYEDTESLGRGFPPDKKLMDRVLAWLDGVEERQPFFALVFLTAPHTSYRPPKEFRTFLDSVPPGPVIDWPLREYQQPPTEEQRSRIIAAYDGEIAYSDAQVGRLMKKLEQLGRTDSTTVVLTADHGEVMGDHNCYQHTYHMWEPALRVPLVISSPSIAARGVRDDRPFTHADLAPTILDLVGLGGSNEDLPGQSIAKLLADPQAGQTRIRMSQYNAHGIRRQAVRKGRYKLIHHHQVPDEALARLNSLNGENIPHADPRRLPSLARDGERYELYDLVADPFEMRDLYTERAQEPQTRELLDALSALVTEQPQPGELSAELIQALENAGYLRRGT